MRLLVTKLVPEAQIPTRAFGTDAGVDLYACHPLVIPGYTRGIVRTGIAADIPPGYAALFWDRSGLASKRGITVLAGVIDAGYRGEWRVVLLNTDPGEFKIMPGDRVAQALIQKVELCECVEVPTLPSSSRGSGGFGSTG
jgi:dUTP pyrophosphatase